MRLADIQENARQMCKKHGWGTEHIVTRIRYLQSEFREVMEEVYKTTSSTTQEEFERAKGRLGHEMYDLIWNLSDLANRFGIDLEKACREKQQINEQRSWSKDIACG